MSFISTLSPERANATRTASWQSRQPRVQFSNFDDPHEDEPVPVLASTTTIYKAKRGSHGSSSSSDSLLFPSVDASDVELSMTLWNPVLPWERLQVCAYEVSSHPWNWKQALHGHGTERGHLKFLWGAHANRHTLQLQLFPFGFHVNTNGGRNNS